MKRQTPMRLAFAAIFATLAFCGMAMGDEGRLTFDAKINGKPVTLIYDSGANVSVLFRKTAERLGLKVVPEKDLKPGEPVYESTEMCSAQFGDKPIKRKFAVVDGPSYMEPGIDGLLSWQDIQADGGIFLIDTSRSLGTFQKLPGDLGKWNKWNLVKDADVLTFECPGKDGPVKIGIDTGADAGVQLSPERWEKWRAQWPELPAALEAKWTVSEGLVISELLRVRRFTIGGLTLKDIPVNKALPSVVRAYNKPDAVLGFFALSRLRLMIDEKHGVIYTQPIEKTVRFFDYDMLGVTFVPKNPETDNDLIAHVSKGGAADKAGIKDGDLLLKVGDVDTTQWRTNPKSRPKALLRETKQQKLELTLSRDGQQLKIEVMPEYPSPVPAEPATGKAEDYLKKAAEEKEARNWEAAIDAYDTAIALDGGTAQAFKERGDVEQELNRFEPAIADYTRALKLDPNSSAVYCARGVALDAWNDLDDSMSDYNRALELDPKNADAYSGRGALEAEKDNAKAGLDDVERALQLDPKNGIAYYNRGMIKKKADDTEGALADLSHAIELAPKYEPAYNDRGLLEMAKGDNDAAMADYNKAIALKPVDAYALVCRGELLDKLGKLDEGILDYNRATELEPRYESAYSGRGVLFLKKGEIDAAMADFDQAIALKPEDPEPYNGRAILCMQKGDLDGMIAAASKAIELKPDYSLAYNSRGLAEEMKKNNKAALADFNKSIELDPNYEQAYNNRAGLELLAGKLTEAQEDSDAAIRLDPQYAAPYNIRGYVKFKRGNFEAAIADFTKAIECNPGDASVYFHRGNAKLANKDTDGAMADFNKSIEVDPKDPDVYEARAALRKTKGDKKGADEDSARALALGPAKNGNIKASLKNTPPPAPAP